MTRLVVAMPTMPGREVHLDRATIALHATVPKHVDLSIEVTVGAPTCGEVWNDVARVSRAVAADYLLCMADDLEPIQGWYEAAVEIVENGQTPSALIYTARPGEPDIVESHGDWAAIYQQPTVVSMSRIPFCRPSQWVDIPDIHYFSDNAFTVAMAVQNIPCVADPRFRFRHHWAQAGRHGAGDAQWYDEQAQYETWARQQIAAAAPRYL